MLTGINILNKNPVSLRIHVSLQTMIKVILIIKHFSEDCLPPWYISRDRRRNSSTHIKHNGSFFEYAAIFYMGRSWFFIWCLNCQIFAKNSSNQQSVSMWKNTTNMGLFLPAPHTQQGPHQSVSWWILFPAIHTHQMLL